MSTASSPATRIVLAIATAPGAESTLRAAIEASGAESVIIRAAAGSWLDASAAGPLVEAAQRQGAAALILDDARLARTLGADGAHLSWSPDLPARYEEARSILGRGAVVGADAGASRHNAMELAESGADYVAFALPGGSGPPPASKDEEAGEEEAEAFEAADALDLVAWWAEIFEPPVVALGVGKAEAARSASEAGADFVALEIPEGLGPADASRWLAPLIAALNGRKAMA